MARKSATELLTTDILITEELARWQAISELKFELAYDVYVAQDVETRAAIDRLVKTLTAYDKGSITLQLPGAHGKVSGIAVDTAGSLLWLAVEVVKDMALVGIRLASFTFPPSMCAVCGGDA